MLDNEDLSEEIISDDDFRKFLEEEDDESIVCLAKEIARSEEGVSVANPGAVRTVGIVYNVMKSIVKGVGTQVTYKLNAPYLSMGSVSITGKDIIVSNPSLFMKFAKLASNLNVYPKVDGTVVIDLGFHGLIRKVADIDE